MKITTVKIKYNSLLWGIASILIGVLMLVYKGDVMSFAVELLGITLLVVGLIQALVTLIQNRNTTESCVSIGGLATAIAGAILLVSPEFWSSFLMTLIGILFIFMSINQMYVYRRFSRNGYKVSFRYYIFPLLLAAAGVMTVVKPTFLSSWIVIFIAIWIIAYGISEIIGYYSLKNSKTIENN